LRQRLFLLAIAVGLVLRVASVSWHLHPRGDVQLDVGVARSLQQGEGFHSGFLRGTALVQGAGPPPPQDLADQHPPLWPVVGAALGLLIGSPFGGLQLGSLLAGLALVLLVWRQADRLVEGCAGARDGLAALAATLVALCFVAIDASGNGSLYAAQACGVVLIAGALGAARPSALRLGLLLGALWLLNYQALVLLPVPLLALLLAARPGERAAALRTGALAIGLAVLVQLPWWWRNAQAFGSPFYTVNGFYPVWKSGVEPTLALEAGQPVARLPDVSMAGALLRGFPRWGPANVLYLLTTGLMLWPGMLALAAAGALPLLGAARRQHDRRLMACLLLLAALVGVALLWPDMKLRYCVPMTPLVILLGIRVVAAPPTSGERRLALTVVALWVLLLLGTLGDVTGHAPDARPERWRLLLLAGAAFLALPLLLRNVKIRRVERPARLLLATGLAAMPVLAAVALWSWPHTTYNSSVLTPDLFGQVEKDAADARAAALAERAHEELVRAGSRCAVGPLELIVHDRPALVWEPMGGGSQAGDDALAALLDRTGADHVLVYSGRGWPEGLVAGNTWLGGRLLVVAVWSPEESAQPLAAGWLSRVQR
jgi:4-amino-4-deoxy-L-arabinose transferase-like glycosyltransferase